MNRADVLSRLQGLAGQLRALGATALYLFGSTDRNEAKASSDVDLFIDYASDGKFSLIDLAGLQIFLEDELKTPVDITTRDSLHPLLRHEIEQSATRVF